MFMQKTLFDTINRSCSGEISQQELKLFFTAFLGSLTSVPSEPHWWALCCNSHWTAVEVRLGRRGPAGRGGAVRADRALLPRHDLRRGHQAHLPHLQTLLPKLPAWEAAQRPRSVHVRLRGHESVQHRSVEPGGGGGGGRGGRPHPAPALLPPPKAWIHICVDCRVRNLPSLSTTCRLSTLHNPNGLLCGKVSTWTKMFPPARPRRCPVSQLCYSPRYSRKTEPCSSCSFL